VRLSSSVPLCLCGSLVFLVAALPPWVIRGFFFALWVAAVPLWAHPWLKNLCGLRAKRKVAAVKSVVLFLFFLPRGRSRHQR